MKRIEQLAIQLMNRKEKRDVKIKKIKEDLPEDLSSAEAAGVVGSSMSVAMA